MGPEFAFGAAVPAEESAAEDQRHDEDDGGDDGDGDGGGAAEGKQGEEPVDEEQCGDDLETAQEPGLELVPARIVAGGAVGKDHGDGLDIAPEGDQWSEEQDAEQGPEKGTQSTGEGKSGAEDAFEHPVGRLPEEEQGGQEQQVEGDLAESPSGLAPHHAGALAGAEPVEAFVIEGEQTADNPGLAGFDPVGDGV